MVSPFEQYLKELDRKDTSLLWFDFNPEVKKHKAASFNRLTDQIKEEVDNFGYFKMEKDNSSSKEFEVVQRQKGIFRSNCLHCLDRTNYTQTIIAKAFMHNFMDDLSATKTANPYPFNSLSNTQLELSFWHLWKSNANTISHQNSGAPAMKLYLYENGKQPLSWFMGDGYAGTRRYFNGIFNDYYYQVTAFLCRTVSNCILGNCQPRTQK